MNYRVFVTDGVTFTWKWADWTLMQMDWYSSREKALYECLLTS